MPGKRRKKAAYRRPADRSVWNTAGEKVLCGYQQWHQIRKKNDSVLLKQLQAFQGGFTAQQKIVHFRLRCEQ
ncbi:hypothetical protein [Erwinia sp. OPT-41]|uniref:hypothetical protein n=1 Tax=Erwinia plantamica TaxID=3237104 RepID=UPI003735203C